MNVNNNLKNRRLANTWDYSKTRMYKKKRRENNEKGKGIKKKIRGDK